jgi:ABC-type transporter Mla subunit MlaD
MAGTTRPPGPPGLGDLFNLFGSNNPFATMARTVEQFHQMVESLNSIAKRLDSLLDDIEGPLRVMMPQLTKAADQASKMFAVLSGPVDRVAPGLTQLADTLNSPMMTDLPQRLNDAVELMAALPKSLAPLGQMADMAGGLFGGMRGLAGLPGLPSTRTAPAAPEPVATKAAATPAKKATPKKKAASTSKKKTTPAKKKTATRTTGSARETFAKSAAKHGGR